MIDALYWFLFASLLVTVSGQDVGVGAGQVVHDSTTPMLQVETVEGVPVPPLITAVDRLAAHDYYIWFTSSKIKVDYHVYYIDLKQMTATKIDHACWIKTYTQPISNNAPDNSSAPLQRITLHLEFQRQIPNTKTASKTTTEPPNPTAATMDTTDEHLNITPEEFSTSSASATSPVSWSSACIIPVSSTLELQSLKFTFGLTAYNSVGESEYLYYDPVNFNDQSQTHAEVNNIIVTDDFDGIHQQQPNKYELRNVVITLAVLLVLLLISLAIVSWKYYRSLKIKGMECSDNNHRQPVFQLNPAIEALQQHRATQLGPNPESTTVATTPTESTTVDKELTLETPAAPFSHPSQSPSTSTVIPGMV